MVSRQQLKSVTLVLPSSCTVKMYVGQLELNGGVVRLWAHLDGPGAPLVIAETSRCRRPQGPEVPWQSLLDAVRIGSCCVVPLYVRTRSSAHGAIELPPVSRINTGPAVHTNDGSTTTSPHVLLLGSSSAAFDDVCAAVSEYLEGGTFKRPSAWLMFAYDNHYSSLAGAPEAVQTLSRTKTVAAETMGLRCTMRPSTTTTSSEGYVERLWGQASASSRGKRKASAYQVVDCVSKRARTDDGGDITIADHRQHQTQAALDPRSSPSVAAAPALTTLSGHGGARAQQAQQSARTDRHSMPQVTAQLEGRVIAARDDADPRGSVQDVGKPRGELSDRDGGAGVGERGRGEDVGAKDDRRESDERRRKEQEEREAAEVEELRLKLRESYGLVSADEPLGTKLARGSCHVKLCGHNNCQYKHRDDPDYFPSICKWGFQCIRNRLGRCPVYHPEDIRRLQRFLPHDITMKVKAVMRDWECVRKEFPLWLQEDIRQGKCAPA